MARARVQGFDPRLSGYDTLLLQREVSIPFDADTLLPEKPSTVQLLLEFGTRPLLW
jgi:hypothetical protein